MPQDDDAEPNEQTGDSPPHGTLHPPTDHPGQGIGAVPLNEDESSGEESSPTQTQADGELDMVSEEERLVDEAAARPAAGSRSPRRAEADRLWLAAALTFGILLVLAWIGGTTVLELRRDVASLDARVTQVQRDADQAELRRNRALLLRVRADLEALKGALPPKLAEQLDGADRALAEVSKELDTRR